MTSKQMELPFPPFIEELKKTILDEAKEVVFGDREKSYDHPNRNFERTAAMLNGLLGEKLKAPITPTEVALVMIVLKLSREQHSHQRDNLVDIAGYAQCAARCIGEDQ